MGSRRQRHWDHAYAVTVHAGQGATREQAILHIPSEKLGRDPDDPRRQSDIAMTVRRIFGDRSFYVGITRAVDDLQIYTTGAETARWAVSQHQDKSSALQTLREHEEAQLAYPSLQPQPVNARRSLGGNSRCYSRLSSIWIEPGLSAGGC
ncbi:hypothetical protein [Burkholderia glumae]|uniref:hypothetical protein n=1 Tax=Burkholderia glumae TaxID=337 RepID=UPI002150A497|nr:hypothetical protein [Burkholderia glumae]